MSAHIIELSSVHQSSVVAFLN